MCEQFYLLCTLSFGARATSQMHRRLYKMCDLCERRVNFQNTHTQNTCDTKIAPLSIINSGVQCLLIKYILRYGTQNKRELFIYIGIYI